MSLGNMYVDESISAVWWPFGELKGKTYLVIDKVDPVQLQRLINGHMIDFFKAWVENPYIKLMSVAVNSTLNELTNSLQKHRILPISQFEPYLDWFSCIDQWGRNEKTLASVHENPGLSKSIRIVALNLSYQAIIRNSPPDLKIEKTQKYWH